MAFSDHIHQTASVSIDPSNKSIIVGRCACGMELRGTIAGMKVVYDPKGWQKPAPPAAPPAA